MTHGLMTALQVTLLLLVAAGATVVVRAENRVRSVLALSLYGVLLAMLFLAIQAPDVTLSELVVGAVALPLILLLTIAKVGGAGAGGAQAAGGTDPEEAQASPAAQPRRATVRGPRQ